MPAPTITAFNGQIKTPWRGGYTSEAQLTENSIECREELDGCPFRLIWNNESLSPFQFIRAGSMAPADQWGLYDGPGEDAVLVVDLAPEISLLQYFPTTDAAGNLVDYVYYIGTALQDVLDAGTYYMRIVSAGITYYWEPITIVCETYSDNVLPDPPFGGGLQSSVGNPGGLWVPYGFAKVLCGTKNTAGAPSTPECEYEGAQVANFGDNLLYTYTSGSWGSSTPATSTGWFDTVSGNWYRFNAGSWQGLASPTIELDSSGACWDGTGVVSGIALNIGEIGPCSEVIMRFEFTVSGMTGGTLDVGVDGFAFPAVTEDGVYSFTAYVANGYLWTFRGLGGFDGCITTATLQCPREMSDCFYRLDWSSCGSVGNTFSGDGFIHGVYLDPAVYPVRPAPDLIIETKPRADGSRIETRRRRETTWILDLGMVPWFLADALADIPLYETVTMTPVGGGQDALSLVRVSVENEEDFSECYKRVMITFQNESATVACCDDFTPPCRVKCVDAFGVLARNGLELVTMEPPVEGGIYVLFAQSAYSVYSGDTFSLPTPCESGLINVIDEEDVVLYSMIFSLNELDWSIVATVILVTIYPVGGGCSINILALVAPSYRAILQYKDLDGNWADDDQYDLSSAEWLDNEIVRVTPADEGSKDLRIMVYIDDCEIGHSEAFTYSCA